MRRDALLLVLLVVLMFSLGAWVEPGLVRTAEGRDPDNVFKVLLGEGRRMFANHFAIKADVYMHSGFYPSIFDQAAAVQEEESSGGTNGHVHTPECEHADEHGHEEETGLDGHKCDTSFMGQPRDWIEAMGRHFLVTEHQHLKGGSEREILPWLKLSADLDPQRVESYLVASYYLSDYLHRPKEAEDFLRQGLRANPQSYEILFELGKIYDRDLKEPDRARNVWKLGLRQWDEVEEDKEKPDKVGRSRILEYLAQLEQTQGNYAQAIRYFEEARQYSPEPTRLDARINEVRLKSGPVPAP